MQNMTWMKAMQKSGWLALCVPLILSGCESFRKTLGIDRDPPDEFAVMARAPLSVPPGFDQLPPPGETPAGMNPEEDTYGALDPRPQEAGISQALEEKLLKGDKRTASGATGAGARKFRALVREQLPPDTRELSDVRAQIDSETHIKAQARPEWVKKLMFWKEPTQPGQEEALDPVAEDQRLKKTSASSEATDKSSAE